MDTPSLRPLPEPDGGWRRVGTMWAVVAVLWALASFTLVAFVNPLMDPECYSDGTGTTICPLPESRDQALAGIFDVRWPSLHGWEPLGLGLAILSIMVAVGVSIFLSTTDPWSSTGGAPDTVGLQASLTGAGLGLIVAGSGYLRLLPALGFVGAGLLAWFLAALILRALVRSLTRRYAEHQRRTDLREHGRRLLAEVVEVRYLSAAGTTDRAVFEVMARPYGQAQVVEGLVGAPRPDAPIVGGTVFIYADDETDHPTGVAVVMEPDPDSIRDPDFEERYPEPSPY